MNVTELLRQPEGKTLEFKRDSTSPKNILRTLVAFANTAGGTLVVGVEDGTRTVVGVPDPRDAEQRLAKAVTDCIRPRLVPEIDVVPWRRLQLLMIRVYPSAVRPHYLTELGLAGGAFVRVGSTNRTADASVIGELQRYAQGRCFDEEPLPDLGADALDFNAAARLYTNRRELRRSDLRTLGAVVEYQGREVPSVGGLLLFGIDRLQRFPDAWIQAGRFDGTTRRRIIDSAEITSSPVTAIDEAVAFVRRYLAGEIVIEGIRSVQRFPVPLEAVREAVINAVVHRDYAQIGAPIRVALFDDRLEVESPGLLPLGLTVDDLLQGVSRLRNRVVARVFHTLGLIEQWGSGIQRMVAACREAGTEAPRFEEIGTHFRVVMAAGRKSAPSLGEPEQAILAALGGSEGLRTRELAGQFGWSLRATRLRLQRLVEQGLVVEVGTGPTDPRRRYFLAVGRQH
jgi:predicted HTH transcriptional regulator